jgi:hypothetical protein
MIIISPYAKALLSKKQNPKNYPYWKELISQIKEPIIQIGIERIYLLVSYVSWYKSAVFGSLVIVFSSI